MPKHDFHDYKNMIIVESNPLFMPMLLLFMPLWYKWWVLFNYVIVWMNSRKSHYGVLMGVTLKIIQLCPKKFA